MPTPTPPTRRRHRRGAGRGRLLTWPVLVQHLQRFTKEDREDLMQEIYLRTLLYPHGRLDYHYAQALLTILPRKTRQRLTFGDIRESVAKDLRSREDWYGKLVRLACRLWRTEAAPVVRQTGLHYFFAGQLQVDLARAEGLTVQAISARLHAFVALVE